MPAKSLLQPEARGPRPEARSAPVALLPRACYRPPLPVLAQSCSALVLALGCQAKPQATPAPAGVTVRDASGAVVATLRPGHPCRARIGGQEMLVGGPPLVAQLGDVRWTGVDRPDGTLLERDGAPIARVFAPDPHLVAVFGENGAAALRIAIGEVAAVSDGTGQRVRTFARRGAAIVADSPAATLTVTGTSDLALAALLSAPELSPEIRMMAACQRALGGS